MLPDSDAVLNAAHDYIRKGWRVIPLHVPVVNDSGTICSCQLHGNRAVCNSVGKHPVEARWQATEPMSGADVQATFEDAQLNIGIATGSPSGFWVLDVDLDKPGTRERMEALLGEHGGVMPMTYTVQTGGGGYQYYYAMPEFQVTNSARRLPAGVDVRGTGGQVVAPPSVSGKGVYTVVRDVPLVRAPEWLEELVRPVPPASPVDLETLPKLTDLPPAEQQRLEHYTDRVVGKEIARLSECKQQGWDGPGWNQTVFEVSCSLIEFANSPWCALDLIGVQKIVLASAPRDKNFGDSEIQACFASALKTVDGKARPLPEGQASREPVIVFEGDPLSDPSFGGGSPAGPTTGKTQAGPVKRPWTDLGNAQRMVDLYGHRLRWVEQADNWAVYDAGVWRLAGKPAARALAQEMIEGLIEREGHLYDTAPQGDDGDKPSEFDLFVKWSFAQQMSSRISACLQEAAGRKELQADMTAFDTDGYLLNCANGVVDLRTGELTDHSPELLMMLQSPVSYVPDAPAPIWDAFLARCLPDPAVRAYLQQCFGYSLTGSMAEQALFIHHGSGANGKSVFLVVASHLAGLYGQVVPRETLLAKSGSGSEHPTSTARMRGKRFLQASETAAGRRLDEETVKGLTGGEQQTARFMGADFFDFTPTGKIHFVTNHLPRLTDAESIWRRLHLVAWREVIPVDERDPHLAEKIIKTEAEGVLAWAVRGAVEWNARVVAGKRLDVPVSMRTDLQEYRNDQDILGEFISSRLEADGVTFTPIADIYGAYGAWCFNSGIKSPLTSQDLSRALAERKFPRHRTGRSRGFLVRLLPLGDYVPSDADPLMAP